MRTPVLALIVSLAAAASHGGDLQAGVAEVELRPHVEAAARVVSLGDVAFVRTADLSLERRLLALPLGESPRPGSESIVQRDRLSHWLRMQPGLLGTQVHWTGTERTVVRGAVQKLPSLRIEEAARAELSRWLQSNATRFSIESTGVREDIALPTGRIELSVRPLATGAQPASRMTVWVDAYVEGRFARAVPVTFLVDAYREAWVVPQGAAVGTRLSPGSLEQREVPARGAAPLSPNRPLRELRALRPLRPGEPLTAANAKPLAAVSRGDWVTLRSDSGALHLESRAEALQDGEIGQVVRVRVPRGSEALQARVVGAERVEAMP
jgi:flagella basal body P-ring formation protein FlgA